MTSPLQKLHRDKRKGLHASLAAQSPCFGYDVHCLMDAASAVLAGSDDLVRQNASDIELTATRLLRRLEAIGIRRAA